MGFDENSLLDALRLWIPLLLSLSVHEWAHAWSAYRLGDDTAARMGRMTINPLAHIDLVGTVLLPLFSKFRLVGPNRCRSIRPDSAAIST